MTEDSLRISAEISSNFLQWLASEEIQIGSREMFANRISFKKRQFLLLSMKVIINDQLLLNQLDMKISLSFGCRYECQSRLNLNG